MPIVAESISLLRGYGGNLALVTQTIPDLDVVYGEQVRKTLQGGAGIKLYLTPNEPDTISELSDAVGMTTKRVVSKSKNIKDGLFSNNVSERTEEHPLLTRDQARRLPDDDVIIVVDADMPIRAKRLMYYDDAAYQSLYESQDFNSPLPVPPHTITEDNYKYIETAEDMAAQQAAAKEAKEAAQARATEKRDAEAVAAGQGVLGFEAADAADPEPPTTPEVADGPVQQAFDLPEPVAAAPESEPAVPAKAAPGQEAPAAETPKPARPPAALAEGRDLQARGTKYRRSPAKPKLPAQTGQPELPLPESGGIAAGVTVEQAAAANLAVDNLRSQISKSNAATVAA